ncbi:serine protease [Nitratireductor thuwali]|uniref:Serine protease HhoA n=1 Tax=Nitratireductor thuwali TaxID=2267699 RepID=A0ABY5MTC1_9HYPH|nr:Putative serine protease HhoA [Nitratireductor thuwali]
MRMKLNSVVQCMVMLFVSTAGASANFARSQQWFDAQPYSIKEQLQYDLVVTGHYRGFVDAEFGMQTYKALIAFEELSGLNPDGVLTQSEYSRLRRRAQELVRAYGFAVQRDPKTGFEGPVPVGLLSNREDLEAGTRWFTSNDGIVIETVIFPEWSTPYYHLYGALPSAKGLGEPTYKKFEHDWFVISGEGSGTSYYALVRRNGPFNSGFILRWRDEMEDRAVPLTAYLASSVKFFRPVLPNKPEETEQSVKGEPSEASDELPKGSFSGSGFFVSTTGLILTNYHVVEDCTAISVTNKGSAEVLRVNEEADLAAILVKEPGKVQTAIFAEEPPPLGGSVIAGGYPLSDLVADDFTVSFGKVTGRRGILGDETKFSMSLPVQPGNSGGPVVGSDGRIVGVMVGKLNERMMLDLVGSTGANFSFAIDGALAKDFLSPFRIMTNNPAVRSATQFSDVEVVSNLEPYTVQVVCTRE